MARPRLAVALLAIGLGGGFALAQGKSSPRPERAEPPAMLVRVVPVERRDVQLRVRAHGTVAPRTQSELVPEVPGRVVRISPAFAAGGFFEAGDVLVEIDDRDYQTALAIGRARLRRARSELALARTELERLRSLLERGAASESALDHAENAAGIAAAARDEASAGLQKAHVDVERTQLRAPFDGRVRDKAVDVGQFVSAGKPVARIYAVDYAEVRLPIRDADLAHLDLPLDSRLAVGPVAELPVVLRASFAGAPREWHGRIVRTEGEIDPRSRMIHVVVRVDDPYGRGAAESGTPLAVGLFVDAEILGRTLEDVVVIPRVALRDGDHVFSVDADGRLRRRAVEVVRARGDDLVVRADLDAGERVCVSPLRGGTEGMRVRAVDAS